MHWAQRRPGSMDESRGTSEGSFEIASFVFRPHTSCVLDGFIGVEVSTYLLTYLVRGGIVNDRVDCADSTFIIAVTIMRDRRFHDGQRQRCEGL